MTTLNKNEKVGPLKNEIMKNYGVIDLHSKIVSKTNKQTKQKKKKYLNTTE